MTRRRTKSRADPLNRKSPSIYTENTVWLDIDADMNSTFHHRKYHRKDYYRFKEGNVG